MSQLLQESLEHGKPLLGNMIWMVAAPEFPDFDKCTVYPYGPDSKPEELDIQKAQCAYVKQLNAKKKPAAT